MEGMSGSYVHLVEDFEGEEEGEGEGGGKGRVAIGTSEAE